MIVMSLNDHFLAVLTGNVLTGSFGDLPTLSSGHLTTLLSRYVGTLLLRNLKHQTLITTLVLPVDCPAPDDRLVLGHSYRTLWV